MAKIDDVVRTRFANDRHRFVTNLAYTAGWIQNSFTEYLKPFGISSQQFNILRILRGANDWVAMNDVKDLMIEKAPIATRLADKLLSKELINRKRSSTDRRVVYVHIAEKGLKMLKEIDENESEVQVAMSERISNEEARNISEILDKFRG